MKRHIAFIGDSYCADYSESGDLVFDGRKHGLHNQGVRLPEVTWTAELANRLGRQIVNFGFGGVSWWHSWHTFLKYYWNAPGQNRDLLDIIVFCHTNPDRVNAVNCQGFSTALDKHHRRGLDYYYGHLHDRDFAVWAREQYFWEIRRKFSDIITLHFFCFEVDLRNVAGADLLPGIKFNNPLVWPSIGELTGTEKQIVHQLGEGESRRNHFNEFNNRALAQQAFEAIETYSPGYRDLDLARFEILNPNYRLWPHGQYATE